MTPIVINKSDLYEIDDIVYFKYKFGNVTFVDLNTNLILNQTFILRNIITHSGLNIPNLNKLKKKDLLQIIINSKCLIMNE